MKVQLSESMKDLVHQGKKLVIIFVKQRQNFVSVCFIMLMIAIVCKGKKISKFKGDDKNINFPTRFCLGFISNGFNARV